MSQQTKELLNNFNKLQTSWTLWYHNHNNNNWELGSYHDILPFTTIEEFWHIYEEVKETHIQNGMFFMMRYNIKPIWEDDKNCMGGCWSYKVDKEDVYNVWLQLSSKIIPLLIPAAVPTQSVSSII